MRISLKGGEGIEERLRIRTQLSIWPGRHISLSMKSIRKAAAATQSSTPY
jgi:hypothetical protein